MTRFTLRMHSFWVAFAVAAFATVVAQADDAGQPPRVVPAQRAYFPLKDLPDLVARDRRGVLLPRAEFETLVQRAREQAQLHPAGAPARVLGKCDYAARIAGDQLLITVSATLEQLAPGWQIWKFPLQRVAIEQARVDGQPALIGRTDDHALTVVTSSPGAHQLGLQLSTELVTIGSDRAAVFSLLSGTQGELQITLEPGKRLFVDGADLLRPAPTDQPAEYRLAVGGKAQLQLRITDGTSERKSDSLVFGTSGYGLVVAPGEVTWHVLTTLQVYGRPLDRLTLSVPGYLEITDVESTGLENWELQDDPLNPERTKVQLAFGQPFEGTRKIAVRGVMAVPTGEPWSAPPLTIENINSHIGQLVIQHPAGVRLQIIEADGVRRATSAQKAVSDMPEDMPTGNALQNLRFDAWREDFRLRMLTEPKQREVHAALASVLDVAAAGIQLRTAATFTTRYAPLFDVDLQIPAEWSVVSATSAQDEPLNWRLLPQDPGINLVRIPLASALAAGGSATIKLHLQYHPENWPVENAPLTVPLPEIVAPQADVVESAFVIRGDSDLELITDEINGLDIVPLKAEWERLRFQSQDTRYSGQLKISRRPAQSAVETVAFYRLDRQLLSATLYANLQVEGGGRRNVIVSLPESVPATIRFQVSGATLIEQQALGVVNGRRQWQLQFAERVVGAMQLQAEFSLPRKADSSPMQCPILEFADFERAHGAIVVEAGPDQRISLTAVDAQGQPLSDLDPLDLPAVPHQIRERIVAVYRTIGVGNSVALSEQRFEKAAVPTAICRHLHLVTIASQAGELQQRAEYQLELAGVPQLQVRLPESAELWGAALNQQPVEMRHSGETFLVSLPSSESGELSARFEVFYRSKTSELKGSGTLLETPPVLQVVAGGGQPEPVEVLEQTWELVHPRDTLIIENATALEPQSPLDHPGWFVRAWELVQIPSATRLVASTIGLVIVAGMFVLLCLIWRRGLALKAIGILAAVSVLGVIMIPCLAPILLQTQLGGQSAAHPAAASRYFITEWGTETPQDFRSKSADAPMADFDHVKTEMLGEMEQRELPGMDLAAPVTGLIAGNMPAPAEEPPGMGGMPGPAGMPAPAAAAPQSGNGIQPPRLDKVPSVSRLGGAKPSSPAPARAAEGLAQQTPLSESEPDSVPRLRRLNRGLLSLALVLDRPDGAVEKNFRYIGGSGAGSGVPLQVDFVDRRGGVAYRVFLMVIGLAIGWLSRSLSAGSKATLLLLGGLTGLALLPSAPAGWQSTLDGWMLGLVGMCIAWFVMTLGYHVETCCRICRGLFAGVVVCTLLVADASADEKPAAQPLPPLPPQLQFLYSDPEAPLAADRVFLPHGEFLKLYRLAHPELQPLPAAPVAAKLVEALYNAELLPAVEGQTPAVRCRARLTIISHVEGQTPVPVPFQNVVLRSAQLDGAPAALITSGTPWTVLIPARGLHVLDVEFETPLQGTPAAGSFSLKLDPTPAARLSFTLPQADSLVRVNGSTSLYRRVTRDAASLVEFATDGGGDVQVAWQPERARGGAAVIHVESALAVTVADAGISISQGFQYVVRQGMTRDVSFNLPEGVQLQGVSGPDVGGWELVGAGAQRKLRVFLRRNVTDTTSMTIDAYLGQRIEQELGFSLTDLTPLEVTTESGTVAVYAGSVFTVRALQMQELKQVDTTAYEPKIPVSRPDSAPQLAYRFNKRPWALQLQATRLSSQLRAQIHQGVLISHRKAQVTARVRCEFSRVPRSSITLKVPKEWLVLDVQSPGLSDWFRTVDDTDLATLIVNYDAPREGLQEIVLTATQLRSPDDAIIDLGSIITPGAERHHSQLAVWLEPGWSAQTADIGSWTPADVTTLDPILRQLRPEPAQFLFQSSALTPESLQLNLHRLQPRITASSLSVITVTDVALVYGCVFQWNIERAATDTLLLETPAWIARRLRFEGPEVREAIPVSIDPQTTRWTISLRGPVTGEFRVPATASLPPVSDRILAPGFRFLTVESGVSTPVDTQQHYALLINTSLSQLTAVDPTLVEPVQRDQVRMVVRQELVDQATEFVRLLQTGAAPSWTMQRYARAAAVSAAVNLADIISIVARDGSFRTVTTYTIKNRQQQFLALRLPNEVRLLSVLVQGQPSRAVLSEIAGAPVHLIALPKASAVDLSFPVQVIYAGQLPQHLPAAQALQRLDLDLPSAEVVSQEVSPEFGIPVARTQWTVYLPDDLEVAPLHDPARHNLTRADDTGTAASMVNLLLSDAEEVMSAFDSVSNYEGKARALSNLKQLDLALDSYSISSSGNDEQVMKSQKLKDAVTKLEGSLADLEKAGVDHDVDGFGATVQPDELAAKLKTRVQGGDATLQYGRAITNNSVLFFDNGNTDLQSRSWADQSFSLQSEPSAGNALQRGAERKPAAQENSLRARQMYQQQNEFQLESLNSGLTSDKRRSNARPKDAPAPEAEMLDRKNLSEDGGTFSLGTTTLTDAVKRNYRVTGDGASGILSHESALSGSGGGMGGLGAGNVLNGITVQQTWEIAGGLSLPFELPKSGQKLTFSKIGGNAKLAVSMRSKGGLQHGLALVWTAVCLGLVIAVLLATRQHAWRMRLLHAAPIVIAIAAAMGVMFLPLPLALLCLVIFMVSCAAAAWLHRRPT